MKQFKSALIMTCNTCDTSVTQSLDECALKLLFQKDTLWDE